MLSRQSSRDFLLPLGLITLPSGCQFILEKDGEWKTLLNKKKFPVSFNNRVLYSYSRCNDRVLMGMHWTELHKYINVPVPIVLVRFQDITSNCSSGGIGRHAGLLND
jgi:hypothetical protein